MITEYSVTLENKTKSELILFIKELQDMLKEKDKEIERLRYIKKSFDYVVQKETEKKNRQIDLMAEEINETDRGYTDYCEMKIECDRNCKDCIKRYYERKSEEWKKI